jgi:phosphoribosylformylglycinamidine synthase|tara:strand:+ start:97 stop:1365 length:1269 start_codon:yes stop_codon:yes gene_type:complete
MKPKIAIIQFPGSNTERETIQACLRVGLSPIEHLWNKPYTTLSEYDGYIIVGGFSYEDRSRSGIIAALDPIIERVRLESLKGKPVLGICNGAQILVESGLVPGLKNKQVGIALTENKRMVENEVIGVGYYNAWTYLKPFSKVKSCSFTLEIRPDDLFFIPLAHGEGRFVLRKGLYEHLKKNNQIPFKYCNENGEIIDQFPTNPNGSEKNIAAVCNADGNIMAIMPHPERSKNGDKIFKSMKSYISKKVLLSKKHIDFGDRRLILNQFQPDLKKTRWLINQIITDNEADTVEKTLNNLGLNVSISKMIFWEVDIENEKKAVLDKVKETGLLFNPNKEFIDQINFKNSFLYLLIFKKEDMVSKSIFNSLHNHFNLKQIISLKRGVLWKIKVNSGNIESVLIKILKSNILLNPITYECYRVNTTL